MQPRLDDAVPRVRGRTKSSSSCRRASSVSAIGERLADAGVVPDAWTFRLAARLAGADRRLQAGEYRFAEPATPSRGRARGSRRRRLHAAGHVSRGPDDRRDGRRLRAERPGHGGRLPSAAEDETALVGDLDPDAATLEGYLFPTRTRWRAARAPPRTVQAMVERVRPRVRHAAARGGRRSATCRRATS